VQMMLEVQGLGIVAADLVVVGSTATNASEAHLDQVD
jgi:hypothetical protein